MKAELDAVLAEVDALAVGARRLLERGEVPDLAPLARGIEQLRRLLAVADPVQLATCRLRFVALEHDLEELAQAAGASLIRTRQALERTQAQRKAINAYARAGRSR